MVKIAPSILAADFSKLGEEIQDVEKNGAHYLHIDVMDGHFVPNISFGSVVMDSIRPLTNLPLDVHLMIENPDIYIPTFIESGASIISVHQEACPHLHRTIHLIKQADVKAGVVLNPATPVHVLKEILPYIDLVLIMTVNPGFGGQNFILETVNKIKELDQWRKKDELSFVIEVDGGINPSTSKLCIEAGADILVAGSAIFGQKNRARAIQKIIGK